MDDFSRRAGVLPLTPHTKELSPVKDHSYEHRRRRRRKRMRRRRRCRVEERGQ